MPPRGSSLWGTDARPVLALRVELCLPRLLTSRARRVGGLWAFGRGSGEQGQSNHCTPLSRIPWARGHGAPPAGPDGEAGRAGNGTDGRPRSPGPWPPLATVATRPASKGVCAFRHELDKRRDAATWGALLATRLGRVVVALGRDLFVDSVCTAHGVVNRVPVTRDLCHGAAGQRLAGDRGRRVSESRGQKIASTTD